MRDSDYPQVLQIWQTCFGDEESYVQFFWENCFPQCRGLVWEEDGRAVSMLFLLPGTLAFKKTRPLAAEYVYAVATLPEHRGKGFAGKLTRYAAELALDEGKAALCLRPANESLCAYYAKQGFAKAFARREKPHRSGYFEFSFHIIEYIRKEAELTDRELTCDPLESPGGMLLALDDRARKWLKKTKGRAYLGPALE